MKIPTVAISKANENVHLVMVFLTISIDTVSIIVNEIYWPTFGLDNRNHWPSLSRHTKSKCSFSFSVWRYWCGFCLHARQYWAPFGPQMAMFSPISNLPVASSPSLANSCRQVRKCSEIVRIFGDCRQTPSEVAIFSRKSGGLLSFIFRRPFIGNRLAETLCSDPVF